MSIVNEESGEPLGRLADDMICVLAFEHAVKLATALTHINDHGETKPTQSSKAGCRRKVIEQFWKLADTELWPRPVS
jgi:hypothetical protein